MMLSQLKLLGPTIRIIMSMAKQLISFLILLGMYLSLATFIGINLFADVDDYSTIKKSLFTVT